MINISYFYDLLESMGNCRQLSTCRFIFHAHASTHRFTTQYYFGLSDWSCWSSGLIYVSGRRHINQWCGIVADLFVM